jgi:hypothetical protein
MNWKTLALGSALAGLATVGCGTSTPAGDSGPPPGNDSGMAETHTYVIGAIDTEAPDADHTYGFNLDGADGNPAGQPAGGCQDQMDFVSPVTGTTGVDNQLGGVLVGTLDGLLGGDGVNGAIRDQIAAGKVLLMLEVSDINSYTNDPVIHVHALLGEVSPAGAACMAHGDMASCTADTANMCTFTAAASGTGGTCATGVAPMVSAACSAHPDQATCTGDSANACAWGMTASACTGIAAGQTFSMLQDLGTVDGSITGGQMSATTAALPLSFVAMGHTVTLTLHSVQFGGHITATNITGGEFGAQILISELMATVAELGFSIDITTFVTPDLMPNADGSTCAALSAGMGFSAIAATLAH